MFYLKYLICAAAVAVAAQGALLCRAQAGETVFDELRFGVSTSVQSGSEREDAVFPEASVFFDPFGQHLATEWGEKLLRPRIAVGTSVGTSGQATQVFAGLSWTADLTERVFAEVGFGGVWHDGALTTNDVGPELGCHALFREYVGAGYRLDSHWNILAQVAHASHAKLCDGPNDGMTRAGVQVGYRF